MLKASDFIFRDTLSTAILFIALFLIDSKTLENVLFLMDWLVLIALIAVWINKWSDKPAFGSFLRLNRWFGMWLLAQSLFTLLALAKLVSKDLFSPTIVFMNLFILGISIWTYSLLLGWTIMLEGHQALDGKKYRRDILAVIVLPILSLFAVSLLSNIDPSVNPFLDVIAEAESVFELVKDW